MTEDAPTLINELAQRILRKEPVSDDELAAAIQKMRSARVGETEKKKKAEAVVTQSLEDLLGNLPDKEA